jgi:predicted GNAT superfamily acetyltransferase
VLALNAQHEVETSAIDHRWLEDQSRQWFSATVMNRSAFLISFDERSYYGGENFLWFRERIPRFVYVDRVVVAEDTRGRGMARTLYLTLFAQAASNGRGAIVCEVNIDPPNHISDAFHDRMGFVEVGRAALANGKTVRYLKRDL